MKVAKLLYPVSILPALLLLASILGLGYGVQQSDFPLIAGLYTLAFAAYVCIVRQQEKTAQ
ncbi:MAG: hypothetical protein AAGJ93_18005, partial [Bacteroidota bacterium]